MRQIDNQPILFKINLSCIVRNQFKWQFVRFIIFNYYLIQAVLASSFYEMFQFTVTTAMPLNIIFFIYLVIDFMYQAACVRPDFKKLKDYKKVSKLLHYYLIKELLILDLLFIVIFILSYVLPYGSSKYLRLIILIKLIDVFEFNNKINQKLHIFPFARKIYTIFKISYVMLLFSHYFGTWFYLIDQTLLEGAYYGEFVQNYQLYYQMNLLAYTPIQSLGNYGRYLYGLYFMVSLITTIAYGDIVGKNPWEQVYVSFLMVISTISLGLILEQFMDLVSYDSLGIYDFIKNYNSLKTCMDDSQVSLSVQNKVRSYLVYAQYQKRYHAHEEVAQKLTSKLQTDLKVQSYSKGIEQFLIPCMPELSSHVPDLCNICTLISFQAQSFVYEELETINTSTQCGFLYKLSGVVQQFIELSRSVITIPTDERKSFNLSKMFLNFNMELAYDSDQEQEGDFQIEAPVQQKINQKRYELVTVNNRKLKCVKISQFVMLDAEQFYEYVNTKKPWFKRIKHLKEQIMCRDIPLQFIGDCCTVCKDFSARDHTVEECPSMHLTFNQRILNSKKLSPLIHKQVGRKSFKRSNIVPKKMKGKSMIQKNIFAFLFQPKKPEPAIDQNIVNILKSILGTISQASNTLYTNLDSNYDPNGLFHQYELDDCQHDLKLI